MHIPKAWTIEAVYKDVNIYNNDGHLIVMFEQHGSERMQWLKSVKGAKSWITRNKTYNTYSNDHYTMEPITNTHRTVFY